MSDRDGNSFIWFLAGLGVGAAVGILYAPRPGSETRDAIRSKADESREYMRERAERAKAQASEWVEKGRDVVSQQKEQFRSAYEAGRQAYQEATAESSAPKNL
jgi:gas vesicle protein